MKFKNFTQNSKNLLIIQKIKLINVSYKIIKYDIQNSKNKKNNKKIKLKCCL